MRKCLYFVCPTDGLEPVINKAFNQENYYCTSLGNSIMFDSETVGQINSLIEANNIKEVTFVLSDRNRIVSDALEKKDFSSLKGLEEFYSEIQKQEKLSRVLWQSADISIPILSYHLNMKVKELRPLLKRWLLGEFEVNARIYHSQQERFTEANSELFRRDYCSLN